MIVAAPTIRCAGGTFLYLGTEPDDATEIAALRLRFDDQTRENRMTSVRKRKVEITLASLRQAAINALEDKLWDQMPPVGREFGSPHFERLMAEDHRDSVGVFDPALKGLFASEIDIPEEMKPQRRRPL